MILRCLCKPVWIFCFVLCASGCWSQEYYLAEPQAPKIPNGVFKLSAYGGVADGKTLNTEAFRQAIAACKAAGGGTVVVPPGVFLTGPITLASHMALLLEKGAVVKASEKFSEFGLPDPLPATQAEMDALKRGLPLISASKETDIAIRGEGTIDGNGVYWWARAAKAPAWAAASLGLAVSAPGPAETPGEAAASPPAKGLVLDTRPNMVVLRDCERVQVRGVTFLNPPMFHLVPSRCREVLVEDVKLLAPKDAPNTDGIDPGNCKNVLIRRCTIDTGDDDIALKAGSAGGIPTENITVRDCAIKHGHGISIGSETDAGVRNFLVLRCTFEGTDNGLRIKSDRKRGGLVENVTYRDISMKDVAVPILISLFYDDRSGVTSPEVKAVTKTTPAVRGVHFFNIKSDGATKRAGEITGLPESPVSDIQLENVQITGAAAPLTILNTRNLETKGFEVSIAPQTPTAQPNGGAVAPQTHPPKATP